MPYIPGSFTPSPPTQKHWLEGKSFWDRVNQFQGNSLRSRQLDATLENNALTRESAADRRKVEQTRYDETKRIAEEKRQIEEQKRNEEKDLSTIAMLREDQVQGANLLTPRFQEAQKTNPSGLYNLAQTKTGTTPKPYQPITREQQFTDLEDTTKITNKPGALKAYRMPNGKPVYVPANQQPPEVAEPWKGDGTTVYDREGNKIVDMFGGAGVTKPVESQLQKDIVKAGDDTVEMKKILTGFKKKYQTFPFRWKAMIEEYGQKFFGREPSKDMGKAQKEYGLWYKGAQKLWAEGVQALGKGNMTRMEKQMYGPILPDPGMGLIPGDTADVYFDAIVERVEAVGAMTARRNYYLNPKGKGLTDAQYKELVDKGQVPTIAEMNNLIQNKIVELEEEAAEKAPDASEGEVAMAITAGLIELFGAVF